MKKKILTLSGSNSQNSINASLLNFIAQELDHYELKKLNLTDYEIPMYNIDLESDRGIPVDIQIINNIIAEHEALVIGVNEHNGSISAFFKNCLDWLSRLDRNFLSGKKVLLISTSPGKTGAAMALDYMKMVLPRFGATVVESFSLPRFEENFDRQNNSINDADVQVGINDIISNFEQELIL